MEKKNWYTTKEGEYKLKYSVSDKSGNKSTLSRTVKVEAGKKTTTKDEIAPVITFNNTVVQNVCLGSKVDISKDGLYGYTAYDDTDGNITDKVKITGKLDNVTEAGTYPLYYSVKDKAGNEILESPKTREELLVHLCDYIASRNFLNVSFENNEITDSVKRKLTIQ